MAEFSLELNEDQLQLQKWVHEFAEDVIRPAAHEWDEREEFPWPIVQQAAEIGLYGWEFMAETMFNDPTGLSLPVAIEELFWGDAGIGMAIMGSGLAAAGIARIGHQRAGHGVGAAVLRRHPTKLQTRRLLRLRARRRLRRRRLPHLGSSTTRPPTSGSSTAPRPGSPTVASPTSTSSSVWSTPSSARRGTRQLHRAARAPRA